MNQTGSSSAGGVAPLLRGGSVSLEWRNPLPAVPLAILLSFILL